MLIEDSLWDPNTVNGFYGPGAYCAWLLSMLSLISRTALLGDDTTWAEIIPLTGYSLMAAGHLAKCWIILTNSRFNAKDISVAPMVAAAKVLLASQSLSVSVFSGRAPHSSFRIDGMIGFLFSLLMFTAVPGLTQTFVQPNSLLDWNAFGFKDFYVVTIVCDWSWMVVSWRVPFLMSHVRDPKLFLLFVLLGINVGIPIQPFLLLDPFAHVHFLAWIDYCVCVGYRIAQCPRAALCPRSRVGLELDRISNDTLWFAVGFNADILGEVD